MAITIQDLEQALLEADKAGDITSARLLAAEISKIQRARQPQEGGVISGAGKRVSQIGESLYGAGLRLGDVLGVTSPETLRQYESGVEQSRSVMSPTYRATDPTGGAEIFGSTGVDVLGSLLGGVGLKAGGKLPVVGGASESLGGALLPTTIPQAAAGGALYGLTVPSESTQEMIQRAALGGATGAGMQFGLRQVGLAPKLEANLTEQQKEVARRALQEGFQLDPTQITGTGGALKEGVKSRFPIAGGAFTRFEESNQAKTNEIAKNLLKIPPAAPLTNENMRSAYNLALNNYKALSGFPSVLGDNEFKAVVNSEINRIKSLKPSLLTADDKAALRILKDFESFSTQGMTGDQAFRSIKSIGDALFRAKKSGSGAAIEGLTTLRNSFEDSIERYLNSPANLMRTNGAQVLSQFREGRKDMANWFLIDKAFNSNTGNVSAATLSKELSKRPTYGTTKEPIETAAMLSGAFPRAFPSSGTAERSAYGDVISTLFQAPVAVPTYLGTSGPVRNVMAQRYLGARPEGLIGNLYGAAANVGGRIPESGRVGFGRALMAAEQQQMQQALTPTYGLLGN
jgi:hypothetical protein